MLKEKPKKQASKQTNKEILRKWKQTKQNPADSKVLFCFCSVSADAAMRGFNEVEWGWAVSGEGGGEGGEGESFVEAVKVVSS